MNQNEFAKDIYDDTSKKIMSEFPCTSHTELLKILKNIYPDDTLYDEDNINKVVSKVRKEMLMINGRAKFRMTDPVKVTMRIRKNESTINILRKIRRQINENIPYSFETALFLGLEKYGIAMCDIERYRTYAIDMLVEYNWKNIKKNINSFKSPTVTIKVVNVLNYNVWMIYFLDRESRIYLRSFINANLDAVIQELSHCGYKKCDIEDALEEIYYLNPEFVSRNTKELAKEVKKQLEEGSSASQLIHRHPMSNRKER